jgi:hypothetical protein
MSSYDDDADVHRTTFQFATARNTTFYFPVGFFIVSVAYFYWVILVKYFLEDVLHREHVRGSYYFGECVIILTTIILSLWCAVDYYFQLSRHRCMSKIITSFSSLIDSFVSVLNPNSLSRLNISIVDPNNPLHNSNNNNNNIGIGGGSSSSSSMLVYAFPVYPVARETLLLMLCGMMLSLWHLSSKTLRGDDCDAIVSVLDKRRNTLGTGAFPSEFYVACKGVGRDRMRALIILDLINARLLQMASACHLPAEKLPADSPPQASACMVFNMDPLQNSVFALMARLQMLILTDNGAGWYWMSVTIKVFGVIYLLSLPVLVWGTTAAPDDYIIVTCMIIFFVAGTFLLFNLYIGDIFKQPTIMHAGLLQKYIIDTGKNADQKLRTAFVAARNAAVMSASLLAAASAAAASAPGPAGNNGRGGSHVYNNNNNNTINNNNNNSGNSHTFAHVLCSLTQIATSDTVPSLESLVRVFFNVKALRPLSYGNASSSISVLAKS